MMLQKGVHFLYTYHLLNSLRKQSSHLMIHKAFCTLLTYSHVFFKYCNIWQLMLIGLQLLFCFSLSFRNKEILQ